MNEEEPSQVFIEASNTTDKDQEYSDNTNSRDSSLESLNKSEMSPSNKTGCNANSDLAAKEGSLESPSRNAEAPQEDEDHEGEIDLEEEEHEEEIVTSASGSQDEEEIEEEEEDEEEVEVEIEEEEVEDEEENEIELEEEEEEVDEEEEVEGEEGVVVVEEGEGEEIESEILEEEEVEEEEEEDEDEEGEEIVEDDDELGENVDEEEIEEQNEDFSDEVINHDEENEEEIINEEHDLHENNDIPEDSEMHEEETNEKNNQEDEAIIMKKSDEYVEDELNEKEINQDVNDQNEINQELNDQNEIKKSNDQLTYAINIENAHNTEQIKETKDSEEFEETSMIINESINDNSLINDKLTNKEQDLINGNDKQFINESQIARESISENEDHQKIEESIVKLINYESQDDSALTKITDTINEEDNLEISHTPKRKRENDDTFHKIEKEAPSEPDSTTPMAMPLTKRRRKSYGFQGSSDKDNFCWTCHKEGSILACEACPRVYHLRCVQLDESPGNNDWLCPECSKILHAENSDTRSRAMRLLSLDQLCNLLKYTVMRMKDYDGSQPFWKAVDPVEIPTYNDYVVHPMDLGLLEKNIRKKMYGSTEAFLADTKWILHNCIIFNTYQSKLTSVAKQLVKICMQEMAEIENCPDCYLNAHTRKESWFIEICRKPHMLVWAKLKGFPFWPAKAMRTKEQLVDVRFFGAHDRAWVPIKECFLYSKTMPQSFRKGKKNNLDACIEELEKHVNNLRNRFGRFEYAPLRIQYDPTRELEQLQMLLPNYEPRPEDRWTFEILQVAAAACSTASLPNSKSSTPKRTSDVISKQTPRIEKLKIRKIEPLNENKDKSPKSTSPKSRNKSINNNTQTFEGESTTLTEWARFEANLSHISDKTETGNQALIASPDEKIQSKLARLEKTLTITFKEEADLSIKDRLARDRTRRRMDQQNSPNHLKRQRRSLSNTSKTNKKDSIDETEDDSVLSKQELLKEESPLRDIKVSEFVAQEEIELTSTKNNPTKENQEHSFRESQKSPIKKVDDDDDDNSEGITKDLTSKTVESIAIDSSDNVSELSEDIITEKLNDETRREVESDSVNSLSSDVNQELKKENMKSLLPNIENDATLNEETKTTSSQEKIENDNKEKVSQEVEQIKNIESLNVTLNKDDKQQNKIEKNIRAIIENDILEKSLETRIENKEETGHSTSDIEKITQNKPEITIIEKSKEKEKENIVSKNKKTDEINISLRKDAFEFLKSKDITLIPKIKEIDKSKSSQIDNEKGISKIEDEKRKVSKSLLKSSYNKINDDRLLNDKDGTELFIHKRTPRLRLKSVDKLKTPQSNLLKEDVIDITKIKQEPIDEPETRSTEILTQLNLMPKPKNPIKQPDPVDKEIFPSLFLDPSITITVLEKKRQEDNRPKNKIINKIAPNLNKDVSLSLIERKKDDDERQGPYVRSRARKSFQNSNSKAPPNTNLIQNGVKSSISRRQMDNRTGDVDTSSLLSLPPVPMPQQYLRYHPGISSVPSNSLLVNGVDIPTTSRVSTRYSATPPDSASTTSSIAMSGGRMLPALMPRPPAGVPTVTPPPISSSAPLTPSSALSSQGSNISIATYKQPIPLQLDAGPVSAELAKHSFKVSEIFRDAVEDILKDLSTAGNAEAKVKSLELEIERLQWRHQQEMTEIRHNSEMIMSEMRQSLEAERQRAVSEALKQAEIDKIRAIEETKKKQWCTSCGKEALFYCCWNTSYCDYPCQQRHWPQHMATCAQNGADPTVSGEPSVTHRTPGTTNGASPITGSPKSAHQATAVSLRSTASNGSMTTSAGPRHPRPPYGLMQIARPGHIQGPMMMDSRSGPRRPYAASLMPTRLPMTHPMSFPLRPHYYM